jgi:trehalose synthase
MELLKDYAAVVGADVIDQLVQLARPLQGLKMVHVNSTREGGGVAEILHMLLPLKRALGIEASWEVITGDAEFYRCTKTFHNALQGNHVTPTKSMLKAYEDANEKFAADYANVLRDADIVFIHDPQPAPALRFIEDRKGKWVWRCHIDASRPHRPVWKYLRGWVQEYDASIFSLPEFARPLPHQQYIIPPSIDPLAEKNMELPDDEVQAVFERFGLDPGRPLITQISRFDYFKDPIGVIQAYKIAREIIPLQLVLAGGGASDDPEGEQVLQEVRDAADGDPDIHVLLLPSDAHRTINALQRASDIVLQKSVKEGFGLTVTEAMWKHRPVIGGDVGGIRLQVVDHYTGFLVRTPEGAALRIRYLLHNRARLREMGERAHRHAKENFLITRHLREYLTLAIGLLRGERDRIMVGTAG